MRLINRVKGSRKEMPKVPRDTLRTKPSESFADRLRELMRQRGLKNPDVAKAAGVDPVTVSQWRTARQRPSDETLVRIAPLLGTTAAILRFGDAGATMDPNLEMGDQTLVPPPRHARNLPHAVREYLAELRLRLTKGGASDEEISEAEDLLRSPQLFTFYKGGAPSEYSEDDVLRGMKGIAEGVIIPELKERGRKIQ